MNLIKSTNPKLKLGSIEINEFKGYKYGQKLLMFLKKYPEGVGISAVQTGYLKRVFVMRYNNITKIVVNPEILNSYGGKTTLMEGCLSYPGIEKKIKRWNFIKVHYFDGKIYVEEVLRGYEARIFQHEFDHLNGICKVGM